MLHAKSHELKQVFLLHLSVCRSCTGVLKNSHRLLLFYAIECGLKILLLKKIKGNTTEDFVNHKKLGELSGKYGHNIKYMLKYLGYGQFSLPDLPCQNGQKAPPTEYNQVWRYGIESDNTVQDKIEKELLKIAAWLERRV